MGVADPLHTYYLTYTCLYNHPTHIIIEFVERMSQNTFLLITFLIFNRFSIQKKFWKVETEGFSLVSLDLAYLVVNIILSWFMS